MNTTKMSLANIKGKLNRDEMKKIMAGSGGGGGYKCCWTGTTTCSECVPGARPECVVGAEAKSC